MFWGMFQQAGDIDLKRYDWDYSPARFYFSVNASGMCENLNTKYPCTDNNIVLLVKASDVRAKHALFTYYNNFAYNDHLDAFRDIMILDIRKTWSAISQISLELQRHTSRDFTLCESSVVYTRMLTECSNLYMVCDDGTCVHDSLVCDGQPHCLHGDDEADCEHICSDQNHNCMYHCHHRDLCSCSPDYFQCLSGGCIPLQKLCDKIVHCVDASDEPDTCVYLRPEKLGHLPVSLAINSYINTLIQDNTELEHTCSDNNHVLLNQTYYKLRGKEQTCVSSSRSSDIKFLCNLCNTPDRGSLQFFSLDRLCVYDHDCDDNYTSHCLNGYHLLKCENAYCVGRFKCPSSYCISFDHICNKVCDCPHCEDESMCSKLLCPGMLLIPQMESGLRCSRNAAALKQGMNMRQVIRRDGTNITDDFPVFIQLENVVSVTNFIFTPETVVYCKILYSDLGGFTDVMLFHRMVSVRRLSLPHNAIQKVYDSMFASMSQLVILDLSHNFITYLSQITLCSLQNLQYFSIHHNMIDSLKMSIFLFNPCLQVLLLESNSLSPLSVSVDGSIPSLFRLSSDIPRLCCAFNTIDFCSPPLPLFVSCSNLIPSKVLTVLGWLIGLLTSVLSLLCLTLLIYKCFSPHTQTSSTVMLFSMNLSLAELITSLCLLSYSVINVAFDGVFGIIADHWRYSWKCLSLEGLFSVSTRASLAFTVCLSVHFVIHIPSIIRRESSQKTTCFEIIITWILITLICIAVQILEHMHAIDLYNYFCFPFTTLFPSDPLMFGLHSVTVLFDSLLVMVSIVSYGYLLVFTLKRRKNALQSMSKRKRKLEKFAARLTVLILSTVLTWLPILCMQVVILLNITVLPTIYLWCILVSFPVNLIIDSILLIRNVLA